MGYISKIIGSALLATTLSAHAGLFSTTVHSRANCLNNESITWWLNHPYDWRVVSIHKFPGYTQHHIDTGFWYDSRVAAIHWGEGDVLNDWLVWGYHYLLGFSKNVPFNDTYAEHCSIIDGW